MTHSPAPAPASSPRSTVTTRRATRDDLDALVPLLADYRDLAKRPAQTESARLFLIDRLAKRQIAIFLAHDASVDGEAAVGFAILCPVFSALELRRNWMLTDLFVAGVASEATARRALLDQAREFAEQAHAEHVGAILGADDDVARSAVEAAGWTAQPGEIVFDARL